MFFLLISVVGFAVAASAGVYQSYTLMFLGGAILATTNLAAKFPKLQAKKVAKNKGWTFYPNKLTLYFILCMVFLATPTAMIAARLAHT